MKDNNISEVLIRIADDFTELAKLLQDPLTNEKKEPEKKASKVKTSEPTQAPVAETSDEIDFDSVRSTLVKKTADGCKQQVKALLKDYNLSCLSDISAHPELFAEILAKAKTMKPGPEKTTVNDNQITKKEDHYE